MRNFVLLLIVIVLISVLQPPTPLQAQQATEKPAEPLFTNVAAEAGVNFIHVGNAPVMPLGTGVAWGDYDNDGWLDLYVTNQDGANALYHNQGDGTFVDQAATAGVTAPGTVGGGAVFADYDNDGWRDLYVVNIGPNLLFHNNGDGTFTNVTATAGVGDEGFGQSAAWGDYDNDGWLDLYVVNHVDPLNRSADRLYHNAGAPGGHPTFTDVSDLLSLHLRSGAGFAASFLDYDDDGDLDLYVVNDYIFGEHRENVLWQNEGAGVDGRWRFRNVATRSRTNVAINGMGLGVGDFDNNSTQDFAITNIGPNVLLANMGRGEFVNISQAAGIRRPRLDRDREALTWCALTLDYDHDGWLDLFLCGSPLDKGVGLPSVLYHNQHDKTFADVTAESGITGEWWTRAGAYADYDGDGDVDFYVANYNQPGALWRNNSRDTRWFNVRLTGVQSNRDGIGAKVWLTAGGQTQLRQLQSGGSLGAGNDLAAYFGLGDAAQVDRLAIEWPSGVIQLLTDLPANQMLALTETATTTQQVDLHLEALTLPDGGRIACGQPMTPTVTVRNLGAQILRDGTMTWQVLTGDDEAVLNATLIIPELQSFATQTISLPGWRPVAGVTYQAVVTGAVRGDEFRANNQLTSRVEATHFSDIAFAAGIDEEEPGSSVATGDFNGDGWVDLYLVNSDRPNLLYLNQRNGTFIDATDQAGVGDPGLGSSALVADFDGDGAVDIYALNLNENNVFYHNRGAPAPGRQPHPTFDNATIPTGLSNRGTSRIARSGDFDGDGDLDIYLVNDGQANVLFLNQGAPGGHPTFQPAPKSAGVADRGGGRDAAVGDFDGDGDLDIYLVKDREANVLFLNGGDATFTEASPSAGVADTNRSWRVVTADFDADNDLDLFVTNLARPIRSMSTRGMAAFKRRQRHAV
ncbi:MAG: VCBS repeat-containing protein [Caldilineaceae bacterium]